MLLLLLHSIMSRSVMVPDESRRRPESRQRPETTRARIANPVLESTGWVVPYLPVKDLIATQHARPLLSRLHALEEDFIHLIFYLMSHTVQHSDQDADRARPIPYLPHGRHVE